jgi:uncharacterized iron-regulated membrane protein
MQGFFFFRVVLDCGLIFVWAVGIEFLDMASLFFIFFFCGGIVVWKKKKKKFVRM